MFVCLEMISYSLITKDFYFAVTVEINVIYTGWVSYDSEKKKYSWNYDRIDLR